MFTPGCCGLRRMVLVLGFLTVAIFSGTSARTNKPAGLVLPHVTNMMAIYGADVVTIDRNARDFNYRISLNGKALKEAPAKRRLCLAIRQSLVCTSRSPNAGQTNGASLTRIRMSDSSPCWREPS